MPDADVCCTLPDAVVRASCLAARQLTRAVIRSPRHPLHAALVIVRAGAAKHGQSTGGQGGRVFRRRATHDELGWAQGAHVVNIGLCCGGAESIYAPLTSPSSLASIRSFVWELREHGPATTVGFVTTFILASVTRRPLPSWILLAWNVARLKREKGPIPVLNRTEDGRDEKRRGNMFSQCVLCPRFFIGCHEGMGIVAEQVSGPMAALNCRPFPRPPTYSLSPSSENDSKKPLLNATWTLNSV